MSSFCLGCGHTISEGERFCANCGRDSSLPSTALRADPAASFGFPPETSAKAIFTLVCGILFLFPPSAIVAVIVGHLSLSEIRRSAGRLAGRGLALTGVVLGYVGVALTLLWIVLIGISIPKAVQMSRKASNNTKYTATMMPKNTPISAIRNLNTAEIAYAQAHPGIGYTCSFSDLRQTSGASVNLTTGYNFTLQDCKAVKPNGPVAKYELFVSPVTEKGKASYCSNESDVIKVAVRGAEQDCWKSGVSLSATRMNNQE